MLSLFLFSNTTYLCPDFCQGGSLIRARESEKSKNKVGAGRNLISRDRLSDEPVFEKWGYPPRKALYCWERPMVEYHTSWEDLPQIPLQTLGDLTDPQIFMVLWLFSHCWTCQFFTRRAFVFL